MKQNRNKLTYIENNLVIISKERKGKGQISSEN